MGETLCRARTEGELRDHFASASLKVAAVGHFSLALHHFMVCLLAERLMTTGSMLRRLQE